MSIITISTAGIKITGIGSINNKDEALELLKKSEDQLSYATYIGNDDTNAIVVEFLDNSLKDLNNIDKKSIIDAKKKTIIEVKKLLDTTAISSASVPEPITETKEDEEHNVTSYPRNYTTYSKPDYSYGCFTTIVVPATAGPATHLWKQEYDNITPENMVGMVIAVEEPDAKERRNDNIPKPVLALVVSYFSSIANVKSYINKDLESIDGRDGPRIGIIYFDDIKDFYKKLKSTYLKSLNDKFTNIQAVDSETMVLIKNMIKKDNSLIKEGIVNGIAHQNISTLQKILNIAVLSRTTPPPQPITLECIFNLCNETTYRKCFILLLKSFTDDKLIEILSNKIIQHFYSLKDVRPDDIKAICKLLKINFDQLENLKDKPKGELYLKENSSSTRSVEGATLDVTRARNNSIKTLELKNMLGDIFDILYPSATMSDFKDFIQQLVPLDTEFTRVDIEKVDYFFTMVHSLDIGYAVNYDNLLSLTNVVKGVIINIDESYFNNNKDDIIKAITTVIKANILNVGNIGNIDKLLNEMIITNAIDFSYISMPALSSDEMNYFSTRDYDVSGCITYDGSAWKSYKHINPLGSTHNTSPTYTDVSRMVSNTITTLKEIFKFLNEDNMVDQMLDILKQDKIGKFAIVDPVTVKDNNFRPALPWTYLGSPHMKTSAKPKRGGIMRTVKSSEIHNEFNNEIKSVKTKEIHFKNILNVMNEPNQIYLSRMLMSCFFEFLLRVELSNKGYNLSCHKTTMNEVRTLGFGDITGDEWQPNDDRSDYGFKKGGGDLQPEINKSNKKTKKNIREK